MSRRTRSRTSELVEKAQAQPPARRVLLFITAVALMFGAWQIVGVPVGGACSNVVVELASGPPTVDEMRSTTSTTTTSDRPRGAGEGFDVYAFEWTPAERLESARRHDRMCQRGASDRVKQLTLRGAAAGALFAVAWVLTGRRETRQ